jgi:hypothetical protein
MTFQEFIQMICDILDTHPLNEVKAAEAKIDQRKIAEIRKKKNIDRSDDDNRLLQQSLKNRAERESIEDSRHEKLKAISQSYLNDSEDISEKKLRQLQINALRLAERWMVPASSKEFKDSFTLRKAEAISDEDVSIAFEEEIKRQKARLANYVHDGVINKIEEKKSKPGKLYWALTIDGSFYFLWNYDRGKDLSEGMHVFFNTHEDEYGKAIDSILIFSTDDIDQEIASAPNEPVMVTDDEKEEIQSIINSSSGRAEKYRNKTKAIEKADKFALAIKTGALPIERGLSFLLYERQDVDKVQIENGKIDYRIVWIFIVLASKLLSEQKLEPLFKTSEDFEETVREVEKRKDAEKMELAPDLEFSDSDFRKILGLMNYSSRNIEQLIDEFAVIRLKVQDFRGLKIIDEKGKEHWEAYSSSMGSMITLVKEKLEKRKRGRGSVINSENLYKVYFSSAFGLAFLNNLFVRGFTLLPKERFLKLSRKAQEFFLAICWSRKKTYLTLEQGFRILQWQGPKSTSNLSNYRKKFIEVLNELKQEKWIKSWYEKKSNTGRVVFTIEKSPNYLKII